MKFFESFSSSLSSFSESGKPHEIEEQPANTDLSVYYTVGAVAVYILLILPFFGYLLIPQVQFDTVYGLLILALLVLSTVFGYCLQGWGGRLLHIRRPAADFSYEDMKKRYRFGQAIFCHLAAVPMFLLCDRLFVFLMSRNLYLPLQRTSITPMLLALSMVIMMEYGGYLWFFPYNSLISMRRFSVVLAALLINFVMSLLVGGVHGIQMFGIFHDLNIAAEVLAAAGFLLILNQGFVSRSYHGKVAHGITDSAKRYSAKISLIAMSAVLVLPIAVRAAMIGVISLVYRLIRRSVINRTTAPEQRKTALLAMETHLAEGVFRMSGEQLRHWEIVFVLLGALFVFLLILMLKPEARYFFRDIRKKIMDWLRAVFCTPFGFLRRKKKKAPVVEHFNFVDTEESSRSGRRSRWGDAEHTQNLRDFERRLEGMESIDRKIQYAYAVLAVQLQHQNCHVQKADTPREIAAKVRRAGIISDIEPLTEVFEQLRYRDRPIQNGADAERLLARLCSLVRAYLY